MRFPSDTNIKPPARSWLHFLVFSALPLASEFVGSFTVTAVQSLGCSHRHSDELWHEVWDTPGLLTDTSRVLLPLLGSPIIANVYLQWLKDLCNLGAEDDQAVEKILTKVIACTCYMHIFMHLYVCAQQKKSQRKEISCTGAGSVLANSRYTKLRYQNLYWKWKKLCLNMSNFVCN